MKNFTEKIIAYQEKNTPAKDKLAHYYWGDKIWASIGSILAILLLVISFFTIGITWYHLPIAFFPYLVALTAGTKKEKRDATGLGNEEKADIKYTVKPSFKHVFFLIIIVTLSNFI